MMDQAPRKFFMRINLVFALILVLGVGISIAVYLLGNQINHSTSQLVRTDVPTYEQFQQLRNQLSEQERYLYEYYASFNEVYYHQGFLSAQTQTSQILSGLNSHFGNITPLLAIGENQRQIASLAEELDANMQLQTRDETNWDLARQQLSDISQLMRETAPHIETLYRITSDKVLESQGEIETQLLRVNGFVVAYGLVSLFIAFAVGRALKAYLSTSAISQRLSLFPKRTPNPIISLSQSNEITYSNPATRRLLAKLGRPIDSVTSLLAPDLDERQRDIQNSRRHFSKFEYAIGNITLQCELHWLEDQMQWDIHLTDVTAQKQAEHKLQFQAYHHPETCLDNQYRFREIMHEACSKDAPFSLGLIEIRSFKQLLSGNTLYQAQQVVVEIAAVVDKACHDIDERIELYHVGDKNFAVRVPWGNCEQSVNNLVTLVNKQIKLAQFTGRHNIELDFGFACYPIHANTVDDIVSNARMALDTSASLEHSSHVLFSEELGQKLQYQTELQDAMRRAIADEGFQLYFQPQLSLSHNRIIGAEVLIRWHNNDTWISPGEFIPLAERSGLIIPLGDWILSEACVKARQLVDLGYEELVVAVNISPKQFSNPNFVEKVRSAIQRSGLPPKNLELEITEGVLFNNESGTIQSLHKLKEMGVMLAIDDFGTGYSSLSYLKDFPVDKLKIDQSFVRHMHTDKADQSIVRTVVDLGNNLDLTLIAEGVEEPEQVDILKAMGCDEIQGYWFSKPLDEGYFHYFLQSHTQNESQPHAS